jgi:hypothetical protein
MSQKTTLQANGRQPAAFKGIHAIRFPVERASSSVILYSFNNYLFIRFKTRAIRGNNIHGIK